MINDKLAAMGIHPSDIRLLRNDPNLIRNAISKNFIIPRWEEFTRDITALFNEVKEIKSGKTAAYIPQLAKVDPNHFAVSICTIDGQIFELGDCDVHFSAQSCSKPITYCIATEENARYNRPATETEPEFTAEAYVHNFVGHEPSGRNFSELCLNHENIPHNPMINSGSIMCISLINYQEPQATRYETILNYWSRMCSMEKINFSNSIYLSEKNTADRNNCLGYMMQEKHAFQQGKSPAHRRPWNNSDLERNLDLYFQCCSIEVTCTQMAKIACTLANGGVCPFTDDVIFSSDTVKNTLSLMHSCGMYDYSGEWSYLVGIPAKSGVSGIIYAVIPNVLAIAVYSPLLDTIGNSVRGVEFFTRFVRQFKFHVFDSVVADTQKKSITKQHTYQEDFNKFLLLEAASKNDLHLVMRLIRQGVSINSVDYDLRSALHVAHENGHQRVVDFLLLNGADPSLRDRWDNVAYQTGEIVLEHTHANGYAAAAADPLLLHGAAEGSPAESEVDDTEIPPLGSDL